ncbi:septation ring formation regulator EzrA [Allobaculum stercoricanis]|uniref:septation ring formation regulator EzrA n=1 Tax=Allobaculum stercoricanis TaxID=174709 RepID=UPI00248EC9B8|nr:septation ring formation regulator EzrA [Allobaculum stercoricanis]
MENAWSQFAGWCNSAYQYVINHVPLEVMVYIAIAILILILISVVSRMTKKGRVAKNLAQLEMDVEAIRSNHLQDKFLKAEAIAKANEDLQERVGDIRPKYEICIESVNTCENLYEKAFDYFSRHKYKKALRAMDEVEAVLYDTEERINIVEQSLDQILSRETEVKTKADKVIEQVAAQEKQYEQVRESLLGGQSFIEERLNNLKSMQADLESQIEQSQFNLAKEIIDQLDEQCKLFDSYCKEYPSLYQRAKVDIPAGIEQVKQLIANFEEDKIDPSYLNVDDKLDAIQNALDTALNHLDSGDLEQAAPQIDAITDQILALQDDITLEQSAFHQIQSNLESNFNVVDDVERELNEITRLYASIKDRFGLEDWTKRFAKAREQMEVLKKQRDEIQEQLKTSEYFSVELMDGYRNFSLKIEDFGKEVSDMKELLVGASSDDSRARKQLIKLQLILNEVRLNTSMRQLPAISASFNEDLEEGEKKIANVQAILEKSPLDVNELNENLQEAIDFIYKLYSNATNLVGVAVMVENAIVFGNRFRSSYPALDSDLTKAEICFQNGEYTRALKIAIQAIETLHPGIYEKLIARKDPAVMNQV